MRKKMTRQALLNILPYSIFKRYDPEKVQYASERELAWGETRYTVTLTNGTKEKWELKIKGWTKV